MTKRFCDGRAQGHRIKIAVILNGVSARAKAAGRRAVKNPVECLNGVRSCPKILSQTHGILRFRAAPPLPARRSTQDDFAFLMRLSCGKTGLGDGDARHVQKRIRNSSSFGVLVASCISQSGFFP